MVEPKRLKFIPKMKNMRARERERERERKKKKEKTEKHSPTSLNVKNELKIRRCSNCYYNTF